MARGLGSESGEQRALFEWASWAKAQHPELELLHHIPNGGKRNKAVAGKLKAEGVKPGVPDVFLPVARSGFHGLYLEMKYGDNTLTKNQKQWFERLREQGFRCEIAYSFEYAQGALLAYLKGSK